MIYSSITDIGAFSSVNLDGSDSLILLRERCSGMEDADYDPVVKDAPGQDGVLLFPSFERGQPIILGGLLNVVSGEYFAGAETLEASIISALDAMIDAADDLVWTGGGGGTLSVFKKSKYVASQENGLRYCQFGLIAGAVAIS